jgi:hypothetical protein
VHQVGARNLALGQKLRPITRHAEADVIVGIRLLGIDLTDQTLSRLDLLELLWARCETDLLISQIT